MPAGRLVVHLISAEAASLPPERGELFCAAHIDDYGKLFTETRPCDAPRWEEDLIFQVGPTDPSGPPRTLQLMLYHQPLSEASTAAPAPSSHSKLIGLGSFSLEGLSIEGQKIEVAVPLVDRLGKHSGEVRATARYFPSRCAGKARDELGRETIDDVLVLKRPKAAAKELNERSPQNSPRKKGSSSRERSPVKL